MVHKAVRKAFSAGYAGAFAEGAEVVERPVKGDLSVLRLVADAGGAAARDAAAAHNPKVDRVSAAVARVLALVVCACEDGCSYDADADEGRAEVAGGV